MTGEEWDVRWFGIYDDARADGCMQALAERIADVETVEQFGERPREQG